MRHSKAWAQLIILVMVMVMVMGGLSGCLGGAGWSHRGPSPAGLARDPADTPPAPESQESLALTGQGAHCVGVWWSFGQAEGCGGQTRALSVPGMQALKGLACMGLNAVLSERGRELVDCLAEDAGDLRSGEGANPSEPSP